MSSLEILLYRRCCPRQYFLDDFRFLWVEDDDYRSDERDLEGLLDNARVNISLVLEVFIIISHICSDRLKNCLRIS